MEAIALDGGEGVPAGALADLIEVYFFAAPTGDDDVGGAAEDFFGGDDAVGGAGLVAQFGENIFAAGGFDEFANPADAADERIIPFFKVDAGALGASGAAVAEDFVVEFGGEFAGLGFATDGAADEEDGFLNLGERALVGGEDGVAAAEEFLGGVGLDIGEGDDEVGAEGIDFVVVHAGETADAGFAADGGWFEGEAGDAADAASGAEGVDDFGGFGAEADDAFGKGHWHENNILEAFQVGAES